MLRVPFLCAFNTGPAAPDMLVVLRMDSQRRGFPVAANNPSVGVMVARLAQECRPHRGPVATGLRLQDCIRLSGPGGAPVELDLALGKVCEEQGWWSCCAVVCHRYSLWSLKDD